jgi:6-phosphogluconolactonase
MPDVKIEKDKQTLAEAVAGITVKQLGQSITMQGQASWVLAGGTTPVETYKVIVDKYKNAIDWQKVWILLGDERCVPIDSRYSNWGMIKPVIDGLNIPESQQILPNFELIGQEAADYYEDLIMSLSLAPGVPRLNHVWLGVGRDGHTLSLFPGTELMDSDKMVVAIEDSPKPPTQRISLSLKALSNVGSAIVLVSGDKKARAMSKLFDGGDNLPIARAVKAIEALGGKVTYCMDADAASEMKN